MFSKKCDNCKSKIKKEFSFCPYCGASSDKADYGILGRDDSMQQADLPFGFNKIFNSLLKQLNKQFKSLEKEIVRGNTENGVTISITSDGFSPILKIDKVKDNVKDIKNKKILNEELIKKLMTLPRKEAKADIRRFGDRIIYEINLPGVNSIKDIILTKLEKSMELKAASDKHVFIKSIPVNLPVKRYFLENEKFVIEFFEI